MEEEIQNTFNEDTLEDLMSEEGSVENVVYNEDE